MKYLITESQLDRMIFKYLNNQDFIRIEKGNRIYFVNSDNDKYAQIRYDEDDGWCFIHTNLVKEISSFFSLGISGSEEFIGRWVENTLQMKVTNTFAHLLNVSVLVENTLQMKVTNTLWLEELSLLKVENTLQMKVTNTAIPEKYFWSKRIPSN